jgi:hypothetical protein
MTRKQNIQIPRPTLFTIIVMTFAAFSLSAQERMDIVHGNLIQFNDNGAWCWYQDERVAIDTFGNKLILGSAASREGLGGNPREGAIEGIIHDLASHRSSRYHFRTSPYADDHNVPAFLVKPDGNYIAMYADHYDTFSRYRIYDGDTWSAEQRFVWADIPVPGGSNFSTTYSNLFYLSAEDKMYNIVRAHERSPNITVSADYGDTWQYAGLLTKPDVNIGYVNGYFKYWSNGVDRIDFIATEAHPRDYNTSIYHGYIKDGKTYNSEGELMDDDIYDQEAPNVAQFTLVFPTGTLVNGNEMTRLWNHHLVRYDDSTIAGLIKARVNDNPVNPSNDPDHAFLYIRYDGSEWSYSYLSKAGKKLYGSEQDYTGLGSLDPNDPGVLYISTPIDPRDDSDLGVHEIFKGVSSDNGETWEWSPVTENSTRDNLRPFVPYWDEYNTALLWWRGTYSTAQRFDAAVVGIIEHSDESRAPMQYIDATADNTALVDGSEFTFTGPASDQGPADNQWHMRTGFGNGGSVFTSSEISGENTPGLKTAMVFPDSGLYDVWVNFWANPAEDWRVKAGLSEDDMQVFRHMASQQVAEGVHYSPMILTGEGNTFLYQAYIGRTYAQRDENYFVYIDDHAISTGSTSLSSGGTARTWYDGISYARVSSPAVHVEEKGMPVDSSIAQNYPNPFNPSTTIEFKLGFSGNVRLQVFDIQGRFIATLLGGEYFEPGTHRVAFDASGFASGVYFYRLVTYTPDQNKFETVRRMMLVK